jgi:predicted Zn-dependent peptidase
VEIYKESEVQMLALAWKIPAYDHADMMPLEALGDLLSDGVSSRLQARLVDEKQMVNGLNAFAMDLKAPGLFMVLAVCNPGVTAESVEAEILDELESIQKEGITEAELQKFQINAKAEFIYAMESSDSLARLFGDYLAKGNLEPLLGYEAALKALKREDIQRVAKEYITDRTRTTVILRKGE